MFIPLLKSNILTMEPFLLMKLFKNYKILNIKMFGETFFFIFKSAVFIVRGLFIYLFIGKHSQVSVQV